MTRIKKSFLFLLVAAMTLALSLGIAACGEEEKPVTYTVTVTCEDETVLSGVKARLEKEGKQSEEKALSGGKAVFELEAGTYTVVLTGVPEEYSYETKTVTENAPNATVTLAKKSEPPKEDPPKEDPPADELVSYTVTVTCEDETALSGVKVRLMLGTTVAEEQPLSEGKATFRLQPANYTATLTGVPAGYTYEPKMLLNPNANVTIALTKVSTSADVTVKVAAGKDIFGKPQSETLLQNAEVKFYRSETDARPIASAVTNESGVAHFENLPSGRYLVNVNGKEIQNVAIEGGAATVTLNEKLGSKYAPFVWTLGENEVPFTQETLESLAGEGTEKGESVYYILTVSESGVYSFDADNYNVLVTSDAFESDLSGMDDHAAVTLNAGTVYTFACSSTGALAESGEFGYTVTITKGDTQEGGSDAPAAPWAGSGTERDPYVITSLKGSYRVQVKYENGKYAPVYFRYAETAGAKYAIYSSDRNFYMTVGETRFVGGGDAASEQSLFETETGKSYVFLLSPFDDEGTSDVTLTFTIGDYEGYIPKWEGSGVFSKQLHKDDPFLVTALVDSYEVHGADRVYFKYTAAETKNYTITLEGTDGFDFLLRNYNGGDPDEGVHYALSASQKTAVVSLNAGTTYLFGVLGGSDGLDGNMTFTVKFTIAEGGDPETETPEPPEEDADVGTSKNPERVETLEGSYQKIASYSEGWHINFTAQEDAIYTFANDSAITVYVRCGLLSATGNGSTINPGAEKSFELKAGTEYLVVLKPQSQTKVAISVSVTKTVHSWEGEGTEAAPYRLTKSEKIVVFADSKKDIYFEYTAAAAGSVIFTPTTRLTITLIGKTWNGSSSEYVYTGPASDENRTLSLSAGERLVFAVGYYTGSGATEVGMRFSVGRDEGTGSALFSETQKGTYRFLSGTDKDGAVSAEADLIVSDKAITWGTHFVTVLSFDSAAGTYSVEVDGAAFTLKFTQTGNAVQAELTGEGVSYLFEKSSAGSGDPGVL